MSTKQLTESPRTNRSNMWSNMNMHVWINSGGPQKVRKNVDPKLYRTQMRCPSVRVKKRAQEAAFKRAAPTHAQQTPEAAAGRVPGAALTAHSDRRTLTAHRAESTPFLHTTATALV